jgi:SAM-dependent methyltransferase
MKNSYFISRNFCPCCGSSNSSTLLSISYNDEALKEYLINFYAPQGYIDLCYLENEEYVLNECLNCKLVFQKYVPNDELMYILYEKWINPDLAYENGKKRSFEYNKNQAAELLDIISYFSVNPIELNFLDFGMGWGQWLLLAKAMGVNVYGMELSEKRLEMARKNNIEVIDWDNKQNVKFDFINTEQVFEHLTNPKDTLLHLKKFLSPNGVIKISVPVGQFVKDSIKKLDWNLDRNDANSMNCISPLEHINCYKYESIIELGRQADLIPVFTIRNEQTNTLGKILKSKLRPFYSILKPYKRQDSCIYFTANVNN